MHHIITKLAHRAGFRAFVAVLTLAACLLSPMAATASDTLWINDFESGWGSWWADGGQWQVGPATFGPPDTAYSGTNCAGTVLDGNYTEPPHNAAPQSAWLISPPFIVPANNPRLRFYHWYSFNWYDNGQVQVRVNGGSWVTVSDMYIWTSDRWTRPSIDLSDYIDSTVEIGFKITTQNTGGTSSEIAAGWYVDDVTIETGPIVFDNPEDFEFGLGDWWSSNGMWQVGAPTSGPGSAYSGDSCAGTVLSGNYTEPPWNAGGQSSWLVSPKFIVPQGLPRLRFWHWFSFNSYDNGRVQIRANGGAWTTVSSIFQNSSGGWTPNQLFLTDYIDSTIEIGFLITTQNAGGTSSEVAAGWYIDSISIEPPINDVPVIFCPTSALSATTCSIPAPVCVPLRISGADSVDAGAATWANDTLCFTADTAGLYTFTVIATNTVGADTCQVTVNVSVDQPILLSTDTLYFYAADTLTNPDPQTIQINSSCGGGLLNWNVSAISDGNWLSVDKSSGNNPDSVVVSAVHGGAFGGLRTGQLIFDNGNPNTPPVTANVTLFIDPGVALGDQITTAGNDVTIPIDLYTDRPLDGYRLPLQLITSQPGDVFIKSIIVDSMYVDSVLTDSAGNPIIIVDGRGTQPPPLPDSAKYHLADLVLGVLPSAYPELVVIDTATLTANGTQYSYQFVEIDSTVTVPAFDQGLIGIYEPGITPSISCPGPMSVQVSVPTTICVPLAIDSAGAVGTSLGSWLGGLLCFQADSVGTYDINVVAYHPETPDTCIVTVIVDSASSVCTFEIADTTLAQGLSQPVAVSAAGIVDAAGFELRIGYDTTVLSFDSLTSAHLTAATIGDTNGQVNVIWEDVNNPISLASGATLMTLWYTGSGAVGDSSALFWTGTNQVVDTFGTPFAGLTYCPGQVHFVQPVVAIAGNVRYCLDQTKLLPGVRLDLTGPASGVDSTDSAGVYGFAGLPFGSYAVTASRTSDDPGCSVADIIKIRRHLAVLDPFLLPCKMVAADVNEDCAVTIADVIKIRRYLVGLNPLPSGNWKYVDSSFALTMGNWCDAPDTIQLPGLTSDASTVNYSGIRMGDVNNSYMPGAAPAMPKYVPISAASGPIAVVDHVEGRIGELVAVPVTLSGISELAGLELHMTFDTTSLLLVSVTSASLENAITNNDETGLHLVWEDFRSPLSTEQALTVATMTFEVLASAGDSAAVSITRVEATDAKGEVLPLMVANGAVSNEAAGGLLPETYSLQQNYPNPFNPSTTIRASLPMATDYRLAIYNMIGQQVRLFTGHHDAGDLEIVWDGRSDGGGRVASGMYLYRFQAGSFTDTRKMVLLK